MHQQQWLAVLKELGGLNSQLPIPNSFPQSQENKDFSYVFLSSTLNEPLPEGQFATEASLDGRSVFTVQKNVAMGQEPELAPPVPAGYAQKEQMSPMGRIAGAAKAITSEIKSHLGS